MSSGSAVTEVDSIDIGTQLEGSVTEFELPNKELSKYASVSDESALLLAVAFEEVNILDTDVCEKWLLNATESDNENAEAEVALDRLTGDGGGFFNTFISLSSLDIDAISNSHLVGRFFNSSFFFEYFPIRYNGISGLNVERKK